MDTELLTVAEASRRLGAMERTVRNWLASGVLTGQRIGEGRRSVWVVGADEVERLRLSLAGRLPERRGRPRKQPTDQQTEGKEYHDAE